MDDTARAAANAPIHALADGIRKLVLICGNGDAAAKYTSGGVALEGSAAGRNGRMDYKRIPYVAPMEDFQAVLSMAMAGGTK